MKRNSFFPDNRGFTLIELLVASVILMLVMTMAQSLFFEAASSWRRGETRQDLRENLRLGLDRMARELRTAEQINAGSDGSNLMFRNAEGLNVHYCVEDNNLLRTADAEDLIVASGITLLTLTYHGSSRVSITLQGAAGGQTGELSTTVTLRTQA